MSTTASRITSLTIVYSTVYSGADQRKHPSSASLAFVRGIHRWPVNSPHKGPATRKMLPFDDVIMPKGTFESHASDKAFNDIMHRLTRISSNNIRVIRYLESPFIHWNNFRCSKWRTFRQNNISNDDVIKWKIFCFTGHLRGIPSQRPLTRSFGVFFDLRLNKRLSKQSRR